MALIYFLFIYVFMKKVMISLLLKIFFVYLRNKYIRYEQNLLLKDS